MSISLEFDISRVKRCPAAPGSNLCSEQQGIDRSIAHVAAGMAVLPIDPWKTLTPESLTLGCPHLLVDPVQVYPVGVLCHSADSKDSHVRPAERAQPRLANEFIITNTMQFRVSDVHTWFVI